MPKNTLLYSQMHLYQKFFVTRAEWVVCRLFLFAWVIGVPWFSSAEDKFKIWNEKIPGGYRFFVRNPDVFPRSFRVSFSKLKNMASDKRLPFQAVVSSKVDAMPIFDLNTIDSRKSYGCSFLYSHVIGDFNIAHHDDTAVYWLPFQHGTKRRIGQGYRGGFSHFEPGKEFAVDFEMPVGTPVMAARAGIVVDTKEDSDQGGGSKSYEKQGNYIIILHSDGSVAQYVHLKKDGITVKIGARVKAGDQIGLSGKTGHTTGPHLHFQVGLPTSSGEVKTLATRFYGHTAKPVSLVVDQYYYAFHPGKPLFKAVFGRDITNATYENYRKTIARGDKIASRTEKIDGTMVLFVRNEYPVAKDVGVNLLKLENLVISKDVPVVLAVEPLTERFVLFMRQKEPGKSFSYRVNLQYRNAKR